jgi:biotin operon repressor
MLPESLWARNSQGFVIFFWLNMGEISMTISNLQFVNSELSTVQDDGEVRSLRELALLLAFTNGLVKNIRKIALGWGEDDHTEAVIFCSFFLAATSDTTRDVLQSGKGQAHHFADGRLSVASLSEMSGIPRQTVRRKCKSLEERGLLIREESRLYRCPIPRQTINAVTAQIDSLIQLGNKL